MRDLETIRMSNTISNKQEDLQIIESQGYRYELQGLYFFRELTKDEWQNLGQEIIIRHESSAWALGDWLIAGGRSEIIPRMRGEHGAFIPSRTVWDEAIKITGYSESTLKQYYRTCLEFPRSRRIPGISFSHHKIIVLHGIIDIKRQKTLLEEAKERKWTTEQLMLTLTHNFPTEIVPKSISPRKPFVECPKCHNIFKASKYKKVTT